MRCSYVWILMCLALSAGASGQQGQIVFRVAGEDAGPNRVELSQKEPALGMDPAKHKEFECNLTVRKTATGQWLMWRGTSGCSWQVSQAGFIALGRPD